MVEGGPAAAVPDAGLMSGLVGSSPQEFRNRANAVDRPRAPAREVRRGIMAIWRGDPGTATRAELSHWEMVSPIIAKGCPLPPAAAWSGADRQSWGGGDRACSRSVLVRCRRIRRSRGSWKVRSGDGALPRRRAARLAPVRHAGVRALAGEHPLTTTDRAVLAGWGLADAEADKGHPADAVRWARWGFERSPYDENGLRRLLNRLVAAGDRAGAVLAYEQFAQRLSADLELQPSAETVALVETLRMGRPGASTQGPRATTRFAASELTASEASAAGPRRPGEVAGLRLSFSPSSP